MSDKQPAGWYYAPGDPPGTQRYWDGELWQGGPQPANPMPPPGAYQPGYVPYPEASQATTALVLSILGLLVCGLLGPFALGMANNEIEGIKAGRRDPKNRGNADAARIIGMVVTILLVILVAFMLLFVLFAVVAGA